MKKSNLFLACAVATGLISGATSAHHSYAMFDASRTVIIQGTVKKWEFTNPHASLFVTVVDKDGMTQTWGMEAPGPSVLLRSGWTRNSVKPGDKVTVELNPLRDGRTGGNLRKITLADGQFMCANPLGRPDFEMKQVSACAGTQGGPELISAPGDARLQGNKNPTVTTSGSSSSAATP